MKLAAKELKSYAAQMLLRRLFVALIALWAVLAVPAVAFWGHTCYGFVGFLAHTPLYAFQGLTVLFVAVAAMSGLRRLAR